MSLSSPGLFPIAERALEMIPEGCTVGLGTGRAATTFIRALGERVAQGFRVRGVATSEISAGLARTLNIPLVALDEAGTLDFDVDGADEVDPLGNLVKGLGGALLREKIVAAASRHVIILVGAEKLVPVLGTRSPLPIEVVPFGAGHCQRQLSRLGLTSLIRQAGESPFVTDNGNLILDCQIGPLDRPQEFEQRVLAIPGVIDTGLFLGMAGTIVIQHDDGVEIRQCSPISA
jgi:ribose 5-phosphate isomerase A